MKFSTFITMAVMIHVTSVISADASTDFDMILEKLTVTHGISHFLCMEYDNLALIFSNWTNSSRPSKELFKEKCNKYITQMEAFIKNVTEINEYIETHNLSSYRESLKTYMFFNETKWKTNLNMIRRGCISNITLLKMTLDTTLVKLSELNDMVNNLTNNHNQNIQINKIQEEAIPKKQDILEKIAKCIEIVSSVKLECERKNLSESAICKDKILEDWEMRKQNITEDIRNLKNLLTAARFGKYVQPTLYILVFFLGLTGNGVLLIIFIRNTKVRKPQNMIILNLAISDTFSLIINLPLNHLYETLGTECQAEIAQVTMYARYLCFGLSAFSTVAISLQRYSTTLKASSNIGFILRQSTRNSSAMMISIIWMFSMICAVPHGVHKDIYCAETFKNISNNPLYSNVIKAVNVLELMAFSVFPLIAISVLSWLTVLHFRVRERKIPKDLPLPHKLYQLEILSRSTKVVVLSPIVFGVTSLPFFLFYALRNFYNLNINSILDTALKVISTSLLLLGCTSNPVGLYIASANFRRYIRKTFGLGPRKSSLKHMVRRTDKSTTIDTKL